MKKINDKYPGRFVYTSIEKQKIEFKKEYQIDFSWNTKKIDLSDFKSGNKMLKKLILIITYNPKNIIKDLSLRNNDIIDPSMLSIVNFDHLEKLDLANNIIDLKFLLEMKAKNLKYLFLDRNKITDFNSLFPDNFPKIEVLSLNDNNFVHNDIIKNPNRYIELKNKKKENGKKLVIQF